MTDGKGVTVNFSNCVFIMTTNLGNADTLKTRSGFGAANMLEDTQQNDKIAVFKKAMDKYFPTEFINRLDGICLFNTLDRKAFKDIIDLQMKSLAKITHDNHPNYTLDTDLDDTTINWILDKSESKRFGAREVQRVIRKEIVIKMADFFITNAQKNTTIHDIISIRYDDKTDGIIFDINTKE
jgi:ATP-dependent Clp protease ATP-binding subunit ClpC